MLLVSHIFISHYLLNVAHSFVDHESHVDSLSDRVGVFDAETNQIGHFLELVLILLAYRSVAQLIDELNNANRLGLVLAVNWPNHEVLDVVLLGLIVDFIHEVVFLFSVVTYVKLTRRVDKPGQTRRHRELVKLLFLHLSQYLKPFCHVVLFADKLLLVKLVKFCVLGVGIGCRVDVVGQAFVVSLIGEVFVRKFIVVSIFHIREQSICLNKD